MKKKKKMACVILEGKITTSQSGLLLQIELFPSVSRIPAVAYIAF